MSAAPATALSASSLAALGVPGLPTTKRGINRMRERNGWPTIEDGRAQLIDVDRLPDHLRETIRARLTAPTALPHANDAQRRGVGRPKGTDYFTARPDVADFVEAQMAARDIAAPRILELLTTRFDDPPHIATLRRYIARIEVERAALLASFRDPDAYRSKYRVSLGHADGGVTHAHQVWELDTSPADVHLVDGRWAILGIVDRWSRRVRMLVVKSESGQAVRRLLVSTIEAWGVMPDTIVTDQGSGFINASIVSALELLGIEHRPCPPGSPERKPFIERMFGTFTRERAELLDGYAGHNVAEAQKLRARARAESGRAVVLPSLSVPELQAVIDGWLDGVYHQRVHSGIGMAPLVRWQSSPVPATAAPSADKLRIALSANVGTLTVGKRGLRWRHGRYWSPALAAWIGRNVAVRRDEDDLGALYVFDEDGRFIDTAVNAGRRGLSEEEFAREARRQQAEYMKAERSATREKMAKYRFEDCRDALLRRDAEQAGKLVTLPLPTIDRETDSLASIDGTMPAVVPAAERFAQRAEATPDVEALGARSARAERLIADADAGHEVDATALAWARLFVAGPAYAAHVADRDRFAAAARLSFPNRRI